MQNPRIALVAHDAKKEAMVAWVEEYRDLFHRAKLFSTGTTGGRILERFPDLDLTRLKSGPLGGDQQIGAMIAEGKLDAMIFFVDPLSPMPHDVDVKALTRLAIVYDLPMACNIGAARAIMESPLFTTERVTP